MNEKVSGPAKGAFARLLPLLYGDASVVRFVTLGLEGEIRTRTEAQVGARFEIVVGDSTLLIHSAQAFPDDMQATQGSVLVYVADAALAYRRGLALGLVSLQAPGLASEDVVQCALSDAHGNVWYLASA
ncbi:MAG: hypothetical protein L7T19_02715 [Pseudomonadales bacterium]|nr:hypothetical protein [Pseudomonadales bacterium]